MVGIKKEKFLYVSLEGTIECSFCRVYLRTILAPLIRSPEETTWMIPRNVSATHNPLSNSTK